MPRTPKNPPQPDLIVSAVVTAVVTVICTPDGGADVHIKVDLEGREPLVLAMKPSQQKLNIAGDALRRVVLQALSTEQVGPTVDLLAQRRVAGRA
jgi:hypothetical protein